MNIKPLYTLQEIRDYVTTHPSIVTKPEDIFLYWESRNWKNLKGNFVCSLSAAITSANRALNTSKNTSKENMGMKEAIIKGYQIYTDGACSNTSIYGEGGAAYIILDSDGNHFREASKGFVQTTNNRMELLAIISAINALPKHSIAVVYTDSKYAITVLSSAKKPNLNIDLWRKYNEVSKTHIIHFEWIKGHNGNYYNEQVDYMAQQAKESMVEKYNLPSDRFHKTSKKQPTLFPI